MSEERWSGRAPEVDLRPGGAAVGTDAADDGDDAELCVLFCDVVGLARGERVPKALARSGFRLAVTTLIESLDGRDTFVPGYGADSGSPDLVAVLDPASVRRGWLEGCRVGVANLRRPTQDGTVAPCELDARGLLERAESRWFELGLEPRVGIELEFYLLEGPPDDVARPIDVPGHRPYGIGLRSDPSGVGRAIVADARAAGLPVDHVSTEFSPGQIEVSLAPGAATTAADHVLMFRELARESAARRGLWCSFLPKPCDGIAGSGLHVNLSMASADGGNAFFAEGGDDHVSALARAAITGILDHFDALTAVAAPTVNSYKRLGSDADFFQRGWALGDRRAAVRVPIGTGAAATRVEYRIPDCTTNPYLLLNAVLSAAYLGRDARRQVPPTPVSGFAHLDLDDPRREAPTLAAALDALRADTALTALMGPELCSAFERIKRSEWNTSCRAVTDWDIRSYGKFY